MEAAVSSRELASRSNLARGGGHGVGALTHVTDDFGQAVIHSFQGLHQLAGFVAASDFDLAAQVTGGHGFGHFQGFGQGASDGTCQPPCDGHACQQ
jgi:hypothetical protein